MDQTPIMNTMVRTTTRTETQSTSPKTRKQNTPIATPPRCPPNSAPGCAASASVKAKRNTVEPSREASRTTERSSATSQRARPMATAAPIADQVRSTRLRRSFPKTSFRSDEFILVSLNSLRKYGVSLYIGYSLLYFFSVIRFLQVTRNKTSWIYIPGLRQSL